MAAFDIDNPYFRTKVLTASPEELRMLLLDGCVRFLRDGRAGIEARDYEKAYEGCSQAKAIIMELMSCLRPEIAPELCKNLNALYTYVYSLITQGSIDRNTDKIDEAIRLMEHDRETWRLLLEKLADERAGGAPAPAPSTPPAAPPSGRTGPDDAEPRRPLSISA